MSHILAVYDIPQALKIPNPSPVLRNHGIRINLSCWIFPEGSTPTSVLDWLKEKGATVHVVPFAERAQEVVMEMARDELRKRCRDMADFVAKRVEKLQEQADAAEQLDTVELRFEGGSKAYKEWRRVINVAKRELARAENCALAFSLSRDVADGVESIRRMIHAQMELAIALRDRIGDDPTPDDDDTSDSELEAAVA